MSIMVRTTDYTLLGGADLSRYYCVTYRKGLLQENNRGGKNASNPNTEIRIEC